MLIAALHEQSQKFEGSKKTSKPVHENDFEMSSYTSSRMTGKSRLRWLCHSKLLALRM